MRRLFFAVIAVMFLAAMFVPVLLSESADTEDGTVIGGTGDTVITATVVALPEIEPTAVVNVYVNNILVPYTHTAGKYVFTVSGDIGDVMSIRFEVIGYAVIGYVCGGVYYPDATGALDLALTATATADLVVIMQEKKETISGTVRWRNGSPVGGGVLVQAYDPESGIIYTARTDGNGKYELKCPVNVIYTISVSHSVYEAESYEMTEKLTGPITNIDFTLTPKESATYLFGFDLTHSLMVIGGIAGLFLLIFVMLYRIHIGKHPDRSKVHSDPKKKDQD